MILEGRGFQAVDTCRSVFFSHLFLVPQESDLPAPGGIHYDVCMEMFSPPGNRTYCRFFDVDGVLIPIFPKLQSLQYNP